MLSLAASSRTAARSALAAVLLTAAALKGQQLLSERVVATELLATRSFLAATVQVEAMLGLWLLSGLRPRWAGRAACACFAVFAAVAWHKMRGGQITCGCFGKVPVRPWVSLTVDLLALPLATWVGLGPPASAVPRFATARKIAWATVALFVLTPLFVKTAFFGPRARPDVRLVVLDPERWPGKPWLLGEFVDIWPTLQHGRWAVVLYNPACEECHRTVIEYAALARQWKAQGKPARVALIATTNEKPLPGLADFGDSPALRGKVDGPADWFIPIPALVILTDGQVKASAYGDENCDWDEKQFGWR